MYVLYQHHFKSLNLTCMHAIQRYANGLEDFYVSHQMHFRQGLLSRHCPSIVLCNASLIANAI